MPFKPDDFPVFTSPDKTTIIGALEKINHYLRHFSAETGIGDITVHDTVLYEIVERIEKRRVYFHIFYNGCKMGELNEISLLCFWILKLMPFFNITTPTPILNVKIAIYIFISMLTYMKNKTGKKVNMDEQIINDLYYSFCYRDLSKEAIMMLAESLLHT
jgi:hypothetical protein